MTTTGQLTLTRVSDRLFTYMTGSQAYHDRKDWPEAHELIHKVQAAKARKDGSVHLRLTEDERSIILDYADWLASCSKDDAGPDNPDALADLNTGRATFERLYREGVRSRG